MPERIPIIPRPPDLGPLVKAATEALDRAEIAFNKVNNVLFESGFVVGFVTCVLFATLVFSMLAFIHGKKT